MTCEKMVLQEPMQRLTAMGFRRAGCWNCVDQQLALALGEKEFGRANNVLYAFVVSRKVMYVGKSRKTLRERMYSYRNPGPTQSTNIRGNRLLLDALSEGSTVELFVLPDNGLLYYGGFHVNLAAGLEDSLIRDLQPPWNGGKKSDDT